MELNKVCNEDCIATMRRMEDGFVDLTVTSPPYDNLRTYKNDIDKTWNDSVWIPIIKELYRVTKPGGVVVWVVADATIGGSETLTSFRQAIAFQDCGWNVHDTMIYKKLNPQPNAGTRYQQCFEYMFVFSKGSPKTYNIEKRERRNKCNDKRTYRKKKFSRDKDGEFSENDYFVKDYVPRDNIFEYYVGGGNSTKDKIAFDHPAIFPEMLAHDHVLSWSNEGDVVYDPFSGSGTTLKMAKVNGRSFVGSEINSDYCSISRKRLFDSDDMFTDL